MFGKIMPNRALLGTVVLLMASICLPAGAIGRVPSATKCSTHRLRYTHHPPAGAPYGTVGTASSTAFAPAERSSVPPGNASRSSSWAQLPRSICVPCADVFARGIERSS